VLAQWKPIEVFAPAPLSPQQVVDHIHAQIRINATEAGDFVERIRIDTSQPHSNGYTSWTAFYLPGPPAPFPRPESEP
jgi:hypothetical protein